MPRFRRPIAGRSAGRPIGGAGGACRSIRSTPAIPEADWPIGYGDGAAWYDQAAAFFRCGPALFSIDGPWKDLTDLAFDQLERWCPIPNMAYVHREALQQSSLITIVLDATVTDIEFAEGAAGQRVVTALTAVNASRRMVIPTATLIVACGGVQTPRLLLSVQRQNPALFGGKDGPLGRFYMGHNFGKIADVVIDEPKYGTDLDFFLDHGNYVRRRFTFPADVQKREQLLNISFAAGNARISEPSHRNGILSLIWLILASPIGKRLLPEALLKIYVGEGRRRYGAHLVNIVRSPISTLVECLKLYRDKYMRKPGKPAVFLWSAGGRYSLHYHSEQTPSPDCRLTLSDEVDAYKTPRLDIDFRYSEPDADRIVHAHEVLDRALRANRIGRVEFNQDRSASVAGVLTQARDGMHQIGAARMSNDPSSGVVDRDCRVHGVENLFLASTCVFPSSGNANPTFLGVALALRLAEHLTRSN